MEAWPIMTKWENHPWSEKTYGCLWKAVGDFLVQQALKDWTLAKRIAGWKIPCQKDLIWTLAKRMDLSPTRGLYSWAIANVLRLGQYQNIFWMYQLYILNKTAVWNQWKTLNICIEIKISKYTYIYIYIYIYIYLFMYSFMCFVLVSWYCPVPSQRPLAKRGKVNKNAEATWTCRTPCQKGWVYSSLLETFFFEMTLGNANVWYHMQSVSPHKFNMCFFICWCLWHCPGVSQIEPLCQKGLATQMQRPTGPAKTCSWCHWGDGCVDLFPRFERVMVFIKFK